MNWIWAILWCVVRFILIICYVQDGNGDHDDANDEVAEDDFDDLNLVFKVINWWWCWGWCRWLLWWGSWRWFWGWPLLLVSSSPCSIFHRPPPLSSPGGEDYEDNYIGHILRMVVMMMVKRVTIILMVSMIHDLLYDGFDHPRPFFLWFAIPTSHDPVPFPFCPLVDLPFCHFAIFTFYYYWAFVLWLTFHFAIFTFFTLRKISSSRK